ncbi:MAG: metallophosphoesterase [Spirochaetaceae bacterium]|nr:MAG: metallophosphoesterase [Spirochaetaceae bacterium]
MLKILASADYHLGMKFAAYPSVQEELAEARFLTLQRLIDTANQQDCALFLIAGDLFDRVSVTVKDIKRSVDLLNSFKGQLVALLPGNHDFYSGSTSTLWSRFSETAGDRILLARDPKVYDLNHYDMNILLYCGPCDSKHSRSNAISWLKNAEIASDPARPDGDSLRIGLAHGSIEGISPDAQGVYFPMKRADLDDAPVDLWIIGHTHLQHPSKDGDVNSHRTIAPPVLIPGTPESDGFDCHHGGKAWMIEVNRNNHIHIESLSTGTYRFVQDTYELQSGADLQHLAKRLQSHERQRTLLRLKLRGRLGAEQLLELRQLLEQTKESLFFTQFDEGELLEKISEQTVETEFTEGSFPYRLLKHLIAEEDFEALQTAYALLQEQKR